MYEVNLEQRIVFLERELEVIKDELYNDKQTWLVNEVKNFLKPGWVAMDENGKWFWFKEKPSRGNYTWEASSSESFSLGALSLKRVECWADSLKKV